MPVVDQQPHKSSVLHRLQRRVACDPLEHHPSAHRHDVAGPPVAVPHAVLGREERWLVGVWIDGFVEEAQRRDERDDVAVVDEAGVEALRFGGLVEDVACCCVQPQEAHRAGVLVPRASAVVVEEIAAIFEVFPVGVGEDVAPGGDTADHDLETAHLEHAVYVDGGEIEAGSAGFETNSDWECEGALPDVKGFVAAWSAVYEVVLVVRAGFAWCKAVGSSLGGF